MGSILEGFGTLRGVFWQLWDAFWPFFGHAARDLEALWRHFVDFGSSSGVIFSILGALGRVSGAIFSQSRILKRFFAKFLSIWGGFG